MTKQWFVIELLPMDTLIFGPFLTSVRAEGWALQNCHYPFQLKQPTTIRDKRPDDWIIRSPNHVTRN